MVSVSGTKPLEVMETVSPPAAGGPGGVSVTFAAAVVGVAVVVPVSMGVAVVAGVPVVVVAIGVSVVVVVTGVSVTPGVVVPGVAVSLPVGCTHPAIMMLAITMRARIPNTLFMERMMLLSADKLYPRCENRNAG